MIEPNEKMNNIIKQNFKINKFNENEVKILNYALSMKRNKMCHFKFLKALWQIQSVKIN